MVHETVLAREFKALRFGRRLHPDLKLPHGYTVVRHPETKLRFVRSPNGYLIANTGILDPNKEWSDWDLLENLRLHLRRIGKEWEGTQIIKVDVTESRYGPSTVIFSRYNDDKATLRVELEADPVNILYIVPQAGGTMFKATLSIRRAEGGPIEQLLFQNCRSRREAYEKAAKELWEKK